MKKMSSAALLLVLVCSLSSCIVVHPRGRVWVHRHRGPDRHWVPGHWERR